MRPVSMKKMAGYVHLFNLLTEKISYDKTARASRTGRNKEELRKGKTFSRLILKINISFYQAVMNFFPKPFNLVFITKLVV